MKMKRGTDSISSNIPPKENIMWHALRNKNLYLLRGSDFGLVIHVVDRLNSLYHMKCSLKRYQ